MMARIRTIKPEFWRDEGLSSVSAEACLLAVGLLNHCDDEGYFRANPRLIEADIFPLRELSGSTTVLLRELSDIGYVSLFSGDDGKIYGCVTNFSKHQVINKKTASKIKGLCKLPYDYGSPTVVLPSGSGKEQGKEHGKEKEQRAPRATRTARFDPEKFLTERGVEPQVARDWLEIRKAKKTPATETAIEGVRAEAQKANLSLNEALKVCCQRGWAGFNATWTDDNKPKTTAYGEMIRSAAAAFMPSGDFNRREEIDVTPITGFLD